jgi:hypothetical protein
MAGILALGSAWYWAYRGTNAVDWDNPDFRARVSGEAWRLDNNGLAMNFLAHPFSGSAFYAVARAHHLSLPTSAAYSFFTSFVWEYLIEFKEKVSINDVVTTPAAGIAMGEFFHKLALYVNSSTTQPNTTRHLLRYATGPTVSLVRSLDNDSRLGAPPPDALGFSSAMHHEFELHAGYTSSSTANTSDVGGVTLGFAGRFFDIPELGAARSFDRLLTDANITELSVSTHFSEHGKGLDLFADTLLFGYFSQSVNDRTGTPWLTQSSIGTSIAYRFLDTHHTGVPERLGVVHLPGVAAETRLSQGALYLWFWGRGHADFAGVGSLAYADWRKRFPDERPKAILLKQSYYYGLGASGHLRAALGWGPLRLGVQARASLYDSIEGLDRAKELVTVDVPANDLLYQTRVELSLAPVPWLSLDAASERRHVFSKTGNSRVHATIVEHALTTALHF